MKKLLTLLTVFAFSVAVQAEKKAEAATKDAKDAKACAKKCATLTKEECAAKCAAEKAAKAEGQESVTFAVAGMTCGGCENKLSKAFTAVKGVKVDGICSKSGKAKLTYDAKTVKKEQLVEVVSKSGFKYGGEKVTFDVKGMTCGGCSGKVSKALAKVEGVSVDKVCHKSGKACVTFDPAKVSQDKVVAAIDGTGFKTVK